MPPFASSARSLVAAILVVTSASPTTSDAGQRRHDARKSHQVLVGQTLWSIAYGYGVQVEDLMKLNGITDPTQLRSGQLLLLPADAPTRDIRRPRSKPRRHQMSWPLRGKLTSRYGWRRGARHTGIDIAAPRGTIISAVAPGRVVRAGAAWGRYGQVVLVEHDDGYSTLYAHVARSFVREGQKVERDDAIAAVGATGNATGPHLHFEVWRDDETLDPLGLLSDSPP